MGAVWFTFTGLRPSMAVAVAAVAAGYLTKDRW
jgi:hypothetical protein